MSGRGQFQDTPIQDGRENMIKIAVTSLLCIAGAPDWRQPIPTARSIGDPAHGFPDETPGISMTEALLRALAERPGTAVEAELETEVEDGVSSVFFEVMVLGNDGELYELKLDARTGAIQQNEDADEEEEEVAAFRAAPQRCKFTLVQMIDHVGQVVRGVPVEVSLELEDGEPICEVTMSEGNYRIEAEVDARTGKLVALAVESAAQRTEDGNGGEEEREEDEGDEGRRERLERGGHVGDGTPARESVSQQVR